jgi:hypothetical protein
MGQKKEEVSFFSLVFLRVSSLQGWGWGWCIFLALLFADTRRGRAIDS